MTFVAEVTRDTLPGAASDMLYIDYASRLLGFDVRPHSLLGYLYFFIQVSCRV